jgi:hypothetical protein
MRKVTIAFGIAVLTVFVASIAISSVTFTPPDAVKVMMSSIRLMGQKAAPKAFGVASLLSNPSQSKYTFTIEAHGLNPNGVYTVEFVKSGGKGKMQMEGIGVAPFVMKTDSKGNGKLLQDLSYNPKTRWQRVEIIEHMDKNPKSMTRIAPVLIGDLSRIGS